MFPRILVQASCKLRTFSPCHLAKQITKLHYILVRLNSESLEVTRRKKNMKRYNNLIESIIDQNNLIEAHNNAKIGKDFYKEVKELDSYLDYYIEDLYNKLTTRTFTTSPYTAFIKQDSGKERIIYKLPYYPDRIVHHAIMQVLEPIWKKTLIADTYQSIRGRGVHKCFKKVKKAVQQERLSYYLQIDVNKFYPSVKNDVVKKVIRQKIKCKGTLALLDDIINSHPELPIGNYISQYLGNLTLSKIDHLMKEKLKCKNYYRYCDDIVIISDNKKFLHKCLDILSKELYKIQLTIKKNYSINKINHRQGIDFLGYVVYKDKVLIRKRIAKEFKRKIMKAIKNKDTKAVDFLSAYYGWFRYADCYNLWNKYITMYYNMFIANYPKHKYMNRVYKLYTKFNKR
jgi:hypothetical protein